MAVLLCLALPHVQRAHSVGRHGEPVAQCTSARVYRMEAHMGCNVLLSGCSWVISGFLSGALLGFWLGSLAHAPTAGAVIGSLIFGLLAILQTPKAMRRQQRFWRWYNRP